MLLPKCRTCGERHRLGPCLSFENGSRITSNGDEGELVSSEAAVTVYDSSPEEGEGRQAPGAVDTAETARADRGSGASTEAGVASGPLTPAERQAKRRALLKADPEKWAEYLKRDRQRKLTERNRK